MERLSTRSEGMLLQLQRLSRRQEVAQQQVSSGRRLTRASDDSASVGALTELRSRAAALQQHQTGLGAVRAEVDGAEAALQSAVRLMDRALASGSAGASNLADAGMRAGRAKEVAAALEGIISLANTRVQGRYIFAGEQDQAPAYERQAVTVDVAGVPVSVDGAQYVGGTATREVLNSRGEEMTVGLAGGEVFGDPADPSGVVGSLAALAGALTTDPAAIPAALDAVRDALGTLGGRLQQYGAMQVALTDDDTATNQALLDTRKLLSAVEDADVVESALALRELSQNQETLLAAEGRRTRATLFDYLG